jgi:Na+(H+)/acetate symporter ActP
MLIRIFSFIFSFALILAASPSFPVLTYSTYLRNGLTPSAIATDSAGNIYLAGNATVMKLNPRGPRMFTYNPWADLPPIP